MPDLDLTPDGGAVTTISNGFAYYEFVMAPAELDKIVAAHPLEAMALLGCGFTSLSMPAPSVAPISISAP